MLFNYIALVAGAAIAAADSTVTLFLPGFDAQSIDAKILGSSKSMTTYMLNCPPHEDSNDCGLPDTGLQVIANPSTVIFTMSEEDETIVETCTVEGTVSAACWAVEYAASTTATISTEAAIASIPYGGFMAVHVTATETGGSSATTGASVSATTAASTASGSTGTASESTGTASQSSNSASATPEGTSTSSNAGMPMMTANPLWVAGGAAALALAAL
ncbi:hypothetical protein N7456_012001 [Penicillium angulare]|uniref:GPI anchored cell wall protein n=1 Tax=Penicillium angulare TaxID=116970 RepID=A0A9W9EV22_9EURO|nr:hypothetical protein N7456_012001 [Penicillium angulare]